MSVVQCTAQEFECNLNRPMLSWLEVCTPNVQSFTLYTSIPETMESRSTTHSSHVPIILHSADVLFRMLLSREYLCSSEITGAIGSEQLHCGESSNSSPQIMLAIHDHFMTAWVAVKYGISHTCGRANCNRVRESLGTRLYQYCRSMTTS